MSAAAASAVAGRDIAVRRVAQAGIVLGVLALLSTVKPVSAETRVVPVVLAAIAIALGAYAIYRGERFLGGYAIASALFGLCIALVIQSAQRSTVDAVVTAGLFAGMLQYATPLTLGALGGLMSERAGVVNIALEGMMLTGAFFGIWVCDKTNSWEIGLVGAAAFGAALALVHGVLSIHLQANQIVSGTGINIFAAGLTAFCFQDFYGDNGTGSTPTIPIVRIGTLLSAPFRALTWLLREVPGIGSPLARWLRELVRLPLHVPGVGTLLYGVHDTFDALNLMTWVALVLVVAAWFFLFRTPWGLRMRAVGEHPRAADTVGIPVYLVRYLAVASSGALAGLGGAYLSFGFLDLYTNGMTNGRGFIALAALVFGKWKPFGLLAATLLFGFASALGDQLSASAHISSDLLSVLPYVFTLVALIGLVGRSTPPAADGLPYARQ